MEPRAKIWQLEPGVWAFTVHADGKVLFTDNGGSFEANLANALFLIEAVRELAARGYRLKHADKEVAAWYAGLRIGVPS